MSITSDQLRHVVALKRPKAGGGFTSAHASTLTEMSTLELEYLYAAYKRTDCGNCYSLNNNLYNNIVYVIY